MVGKPWAGRMGVALLLALVGLSLGSPQSPKDLVGCLSRRLPAPVGPSPVPPTPPPGIAPAPPPRLRTVARWGFQDHPLRVAWSPERSWLALASATRLYVYHFPSLRLLAFFTAEGPLETVTFAPRAALLFGRQRDGTVRAWAIDARKERWSLRMPGSGLVVAPDGRWLAIGGSNGAHLLEAATGRPRHAWPDAQPLAFSPDGTHLILCVRPPGLPAAAACTGAAGLQIVEVPTGQIRRTLSGFVAPHWTPDGRAVLAADPEGTIWRIDREGGPDRPVGKGPGAPIQEIVSSPDGRWLAIWNGGALDLMELPSGASRRLVAGGPGAFSPDGRFLFWVRHTPPALMERDLRTGAERSIGALEPLEADAGLRLSLSFDGRWVALWRTEGPSGAPPEARIWEVSTSALRYRFLPRRMPIWALAFSPDGRFLGALEEGHLRFRPVVPGAPIPPAPTGVPGEARSLAFSPDGRRLALGLVDHRIAVFERTSTGDGSLFLLRGHEEPVLALAFSPDGRTLASAAWDRTVRLWDVERGILRGRLDHPAEVWDVAFAPDGQLLASAGDDGGLRLWWETAAGIEGRLLARYPVRMYRIAFSPDGRWLAAALADGTVRLWETGAGQESQVLVLGARAVRALAFSPDGRLLAAGDAEGRARLWSIPVGEPQVEWQEAGDAFYSMAFSPQGRWLAAGLRSGTLWLGEVLP